MKIQSDITKFLLRNSIITYSVVILGAVSIITSMIVVRNTLQEGRKMVYMIAQDGAVIPLKLMDEQESIGIQMKGHLSYFVDCYYNINQFNWEKKINKALALGELTKDFNQREKAGYYTYIKFGGERLADIYPEDIEIFPISENRATFKITVSLTEQQAGTVKKMLVFAKGDIRVTDRHFPNNPYGMFIENYIEEKTIQIQE